MTGLEVLIMIAVVLVVGSCLSARRRGRSACLCEEGEWSVWGLIVGLVVFAVVMGVAFWLINILGTEQQAVKNITDDCNIGAISNGTLPDKCDDLVGA